MKYMGSKNRISKYILPLMLKNKQPEQYWVEPFVGGANIIDKVIGNRIGSDINKYLIAFLKYCQENIPFTPPPVDEFLYKNIQLNKDNFPDWLVGYVGFNLSFGAKFFNGYRRDRKGDRNYEQEAIKNIKNQQKNLIGIEFICSDYLSLEIPDNSIIYCDPPYNNTTKYKDSIDYSNFYDWCRLMKSKGHSIYISEYNMPSDFSVIWEREINSNLHVHSTGKKGIERLYTLL